MIRTVLPAPVRYPGIAADRWWQFEDARVNLGRVEGDPGELLRLLLVDFALMYSNDWFVIPVDATFGAAYRMKTLIVTDAFGERTLVPHYASQGGADWRMFSVSPSDDVLFLPPVLAGSLHGEPVEDVGFIRDELSNLVWAVERVTPSLNGGAFDREAARRRDDGEAAPPEPSAGELRYRLATTVPENWIPFQPVRLERAGRDAPAAGGGAARPEDGEVGFTRPLGRVLEPEREDFCALRGGGPARRRAGDPPVPVRALDRRLDRALARAPQDRRPRRGVERPALRPGRGVGAAATLAL